MIVNNSQRSALACARKWFFAYGLGVARPASGALKFGKIWHATLDAYWGAPGQTYGDMEAGKHAIESLDLEPDDEALALGMLHGYHARWGKETWIVEHVELQLAADLPNGDRWYGQIDKLARDARGQLWVVDHKSFTGAPIDWRSRNPYAPQLSSYAWLCAENGIEVVGWVWDIARKLVAPKPAEWSVVRKRGKGDDVGQVERLAHKAPLGATRELLLAALELNGLSPDDDPWAAQKLLELDGQPDPFFRREYQRVGVQSDCDVEELEAVAAIAGYYRDLFADYAPIREEGEDLLEYSRRTNAECGSLFPRQAITCRLYNRPCGFLSACQHGDFSGLVASDAPGFTVPDEGDNGGDE